MATLSPPDRDTTTLIARIGFAARGVMYLLIGASAAAAAFHADQPVQGPTGALQQIIHKPLGGIAVLAVATGLACLALWFAIQGVMRCFLDSGGKRWLLAAGMFGDAIVYIGFVIATAALVLGWHVSGERQVQSWVGWIGHHPFGRWGVGLAGIALLGGGIGMAIWAWTHDIQKTLSLPAAQKRLTEPVSRCGVTGRGAAIALIGFYVLAAAVDANPHEAHELGGALQHLRHHAYGWIALILFALAFGASAFFDFLVALYRRP